MPQRQVEARGIMGDHFSVIFLPGASSVAPDLSLLRLAPDDGLEFQMVGYPGWKRYIGEDFSALALLRELTDEVVKRVPEGPIVLVGESLGGHFCYAIALELLDRGRQVAGVCLIDSFMVHSAGPSRGWIGRAVEDALDLLRRGQVREFLQHLRSKVYRALVRLAGARLAGLLRGRSTPVTDPVLESEISMRLLLRETAPWIASLSITIPDNSPCRFRCCARHVPRPTMQPGSDAARRSGSWKCAADTTHFSRWNMWLPCAMPSTPREGTGAATSGAQRP